jgi:ABC-2 type transport system permease protein
MNKKMLILIFLIIPIGCSCILGYEMGFRRIENIPVVFMDQDQSDFTSTLKQYVSDSSSFNVIGSVDTDQEMKDMLIKGDAMIGIVFPEGLYKDVLKGNSPKILVLYDGTKLHLLAFSKSTLSEILLTAQAGYMQNVFEGKLSVVPADVMDYTMPMDVTYQTMFNSAKSMSNFLLPGLLGALLQVGMTIVGVEASKLERRSFLGDIRRIGMYSLLGTASLLLCYFLQWAFFGMPYKGTLIGGLVTSLIFTFCMTTFGYLMGMTIPDRVLSTQVACVLVLPTSLLAGYTFPLLAMPPFFQTIGKAMAFSWYGDAIRNLTLMELQFHHLIPAIKSMALIFIVELALLFFVKTLREAKEKRVCYEEAAQ